VLATSTRSERVKPARPIGGAVGAGGRLADLPAIDAMLMMRPPLRPSIIGGQHALLQRNVALRFTVGTCVHSAESCP
jgi:hypothetical protein